MPKSWLDRIEPGLIFVLSGFVFWPNAISSIGLILLLIIRIISVRKTAFPNLKDLWLLTPIAVLIVAWIFHGFATDGQRELQLWLTWIAAFIYFKSSPFKAQFSKSFVLLSFIQALVVLIYFTFAEPMSGLGFSHQFCFERLAGGGELGDAEVGVQQGGVEAARGPVGPACCVHFG